MPEDMIRHSDFYQIYRGMNPDRQRRIRMQTGRLIEENPSCRLKITAGPLYFMMHYLMSDLYAALSIYLTGLEDGEKKEEILIRLDERLVSAGEKMNRRVKRIMSLPGAFAVARRLVPGLMTMGNGRGFRVAPKDCGKNGFGFDVTECPYCRLFAEYGAEELGPVFCRFDDIVGSGIDGLVFVREGTLCRGDDKCDFRYLKKKRK